MTPKQRQCYDLILAFKAEKGFSPSYEEIAHALGLRSKHSAHRMVTALVEQGRLTRQPGVCRSVDLPERNATMTLTNVANHVDRVLRQHDRGDIGAAGVLDEFRNVLAMLRSTL